MEIQNNNNKQEIKINSIGDRLSELLLNSITSFQFQLRRANGELTLEEDKLDYSSRQLIKVRSLPRIISSQVEMITLSRAIVKETSKDNPRPNDYDNLIEILNFLKYAEKQIIIAEQTKSLKDDFIIKRERYDGQVSELTENFYDMMDALETSFEMIYQILLKSGLLIETIKNGGRSKKFNEIF